MHSPQASSEAIQSQIPAVLIDNLISEKTLLHSRNEKLETSRMLGRAYSKRVVLQHTDAPFVLHHTPYILWRRRSNKHVLEGPNHPNNTLHHTPLACSLFASLTVSSVSRTARLGTPATRAFALFDCRCPMKCHTTSSGICGDLSISSWA